MKRHFYVETEHATSETSDRLEAARIAAEWRKRGYRVDTVVVDVSDTSVEQADSAELISPAVPAESATPV